MASREGEHVRGRHAKRPDPKCLKCNPAAVKVAVLTDDDPVVEAPAPPAKPKRDRAKAKLPVAPVETVPTAPVAVDVAAAIQRSTVVYTSREAWLQAGVTAMRPAFIEAGAPIPERVQVSVGWPGGRGKKEGVIGQCWPTSSAGDGLHHIFISPSVVAPVEVLEVLSHELVHASVPKGSSHRAPFARAAAKLGHLPPWPGTSAGPDMIVRFTALAAELGAYDHGGLNKLAGRQMVQGTRMLKIECPTCGCILRMTQKWIDEAGTPTCGCGGLMEVA